MKKLFLVLASVAMFSTVNANSLETETKVNPITEKQIVHENPTYTEFNIYADIECKILVKRITVDKLTNTVSTEYFNRENNTDICLK